MTSTLCVICGSDAYFCAIWSSDAVIGHCRARRHWLAISASSAALMLISAPSAALMFISASSAALVLISASSAALVLIAAPSAALML
ncbi:MAG: hypothetical protein ABI665_10590 [Vicinamibacterales bacterium]